MHSQHAFKACIHKGNLGALRQVMRKSLESLKQRKTMTSKERVNHALNHKTADRVAVDFGSTLVTGMHVTGVAQLRDYYGLEKHPVKVCDPYQMLGEIEDDLLDAIGIDTISLPSPRTLLKLFKAGDFIAELTRHIPPKHKHLIRY